MAGIGRASADKAIRGSLGLRGATATALLAAMLTLGGCGTWADPTEWSDPTGLFSDDSADTPPAAGSPATTGGTDDRFPNLGRVPPRPVEMSSSGERRQAIDSLNADRANARHTDEELRARPADSNAPPPAPRAPVTQLPSSAPTAQPRGAIEPQRPVAQPGAQQAMPGQTMPAQGVAPAPAPRGAGMADTFSSSLAQSSANTLPPNLAQQNTAAPGFGTPNYMPLPGSQQLLAIIRFNNNETALGNDDKALVRKVAEYYKGVGGKGSVRVVGYGLAAGGLPQRRIDNVTAELKRRGVAQLAAAISPPAAYGAGAEDYTRRIEIYLVN